MAGFPQSLRPNSSFSSIISISSQQHFLYKLIFFLTFLPIFLALFAFFLQWRGSGGGVIDPITRWSFDRHGEFPGMIDSPVIKSSASVNAKNNCSNNVLRQTTTSPVFPYFRGWTFNHNDSTRSPKVSSSTHFLFKFTSFFWVFLKLFFVKPIVSIISLSGFVLTIVDDFHFWVFLSIWVY